MQLEHLTALGSQFDTELYFQIDMVSRDAQALEELNTFLMGYVPSIRFYALADLDEVGRIWDHIRQRPTVTDVVFDLTTSLVFMTNTVSKDGWEHLCGELARSWGCLVPEGGENLSMVMLNDEAERFADKRNVKAFLIHNAWLATLYYLRTSQYVSKFMSDAALAAAKAYQTEKLNGTVA